MTSKLTSLLFETTSCYESNLQTLLVLLQGCEKGSLAVAGEVCLTGYDYANMQKMLDFEPKAREEIAKASVGKTVVLTMLARDGKDVKNFAYVFHDGELLRKQAKAKLFKLGDEHKYIAPGEEEDIVIFEAGGVKLGVLICFELRFKKLWMQLEGADVIAVPSWWGKERKSHYITLTNALAVMNECYVLCSDNLHVDCHGESGIITPFGEERRNKGRPIASLPFDKNEIKKMRRYMDIGIEA